MQILARKARAIGTCERNLELRVCAVADADIVEQLAHRDHRLLRRDRNDERPFDGAAARLADAHDHARLDRQRRLELRQIGGERRLALRVGLGLVLDLLADRLEAFVIDAVGKSIEAGDRILLGAAHENLARDFKVRSRRAIEIARIDIHLGRLVSADRRLHRRELQIDALGHIILDEEGRVADRFALGIGVDLETPCAALRAGDQRQRIGSAAEPLILHDDAAIFDSIRALGDERERQVARGAALRVAQQSRDLHSLAAAIDASLREQQRVERAGRRASLHAAIGQIERGRFQIEETVVAVRGDGDEARRHAGRAAREAGIEGNDAARVRRLRRQDFVVLRDQPDLRAGDRLRGGERAHDHMHAVLAGKSGETEIGHDEPLRGDGVIVAVILVLGRLRLLLGARGHHIDAGLERLHGFEHGESGGHVAVEIARDGERAFPDLHALLRLDVPRRGLREIGQELVRAHCRQEAAVADAIDLDEHFARIHRDDRNSLLAGARQDVVLAREAHLRRAVADVDVLIDGFQQRLVDARRQALAQRDRITLAMLQTFDAKLPAFRIHGRAGDARHRDIGREVDAAARQRLGELKADARRRSVRIDLVVGHAEALGLAQLLIGLADAGVVDQREARLVGVERGAPLLALGEQAREIRQRGRFLFAAAGTGVIAIGRRERAAAQLPAFGIVGARINAGRGARIDEPGRGVARVGRHGAGREPQRLARIAGERRFGVSPQRVRGLTGERGALAFQRVLEPDERIGEILAEIAFLLGLGRIDGEENEQDKNECVPGARNHLKTSSFNRAC